MPSRNGWFFLNDGPMANGSVLSIQPNLPPHPKGPGSVFSLEIPGKDPASHVCHGREELHDIR